MMGFIWLSDCYWEWKVSLIQSNASANSWGPSLDSLLAKPTTVSGEDAQHQTHNTDPERKLYSLQVGCRFFSVPVKEFNKQGFYDEGLAFKVPNLKDKKVIIIGQWYDKANAFSSVIFCPLRQICPEMYSIGCIFMVISVPLPFMTTSSQPHGNQNGQERL